MRYVSNSDVQSFKDCRRRWWLGSVRNLVPAAWGEESEPGTEAHKGSLVHRGLAVLYATGDLVTAVAALPPELRVVIDGQEVYDERYAKDRALAVRMLEGYVEWLDETGADSALEVLGIEEEITFDASEYLGFAVTLIGKADLRVRDLVTGARRIVDHKTVGAISSDVWSHREQLLMYCTIDRLRHSEGWVDGAFVNQLRKVKRTAQANPPFYGRFEVRFNEEELRAFWFGLDRIVHEMEAIRAALDAGVPPLQAGVVPRPNGDCSWRCEFLHVCPMFDDGSRVEDAIKVHFRPRATHRYDTVGTSETQTETKETT